MKIGYFVNDFPYKDPHTGIEIDRSFYGGVGNVAYNLAIEMIKRGHKVYVFTSSIDSGNYIEDYGDIIIYRYKQNFTVGQSPCSIDLTYKPLFLNLNIDVVHVHAGNPPSTITAYWYAKKYKIPFVVSYHGDVVWNFGSLIRKICVYSYSKFCITKVLSHACMIISPSINYIEESSLLTKFQKKIAVIPNGINEDEFDIKFSKEECRTKLKLPVDGKIMLFVGGLNPHKGPDSLLKIMPDLLKEIPDAFLVFVGDGVLRKELENLSINLDIEENVMFVGFVEDELKPLYYKSSDIFCLPSIREPFGIVNLEAMASEIPIVAFSCGGVLDFVFNGKNGFLVPPQDIISFSKTLLYLLTNDDVRLKMGNTGKEMVKNYSWDKAAEATENIYFGLKSQL